MEQGKRLEECLCVRRSIRQFTDQPVERTIIQTLLEMAILAPSASNRQPWRFIILDDPVLVQKIRAFSPGIGGNPPCLIVFCLDSQRLPVMRNGTIDRTCGIIDLAMAAENMMLAATSHGLGTCVIKSYHPQIVKKILEDHGGKVWATSRLGIGTIMYLPGVYSNAWIPKVESTDAKTAVTGGNIFL